MSEANEIKEKLRALRPMLEDKYPIASLGLFGSVLRNDFTAASDIDILVEFYKPVGIEFIDLANELEELLQRKVDLVSRKGIKKGYYQAIESGIEYV